MLSNLRQQCSERLIKWVLRRHPGTTGSININRKRIYILPTRYGYYFALMLVLMLLGAINYQNSLSYMLTFFLAALAGNAMLHTHRNLLNLSARIRSEGDIFSTQQHCLTLILLNRSEYPRHDIISEFEQPLFTRCFIPAKTEKKLAIPIQIHQRGIHSVGRIKIYSRYPLGLFQAWSWLNFDLKITVFPAPLDNGAIFSIPSTSSASGDKFIVGSDDFSNLRDYRPTDSPKHIAWKKITYNKPWLTKEFISKTSRELILDWRQISNADDEQRLSILCAWILKADTQGLNYGLQLPGKEIIPGSGAKHRHDCLTALATW